MNSCTASADILLTAQTKNVRSKYLSARRGISSQRGRWRLRRKIWRPARHKYSDKVPTGHSQLQNAFRNKNAIATNVMKRNIAAGCTTGMLPVVIQYFVFISPAIGSQPS